MAAAPEAPTASSRAFKLLILDEIWCDPIDFSSKYRSAV
jgi:hypothetical protein